MVRTILIGLGGGLLLAILDGLINANPLAVQLLAAYKPIARTTINPLAGVAIDLVYGLVIAGVFVLLFPSLPGGSGFVKGLSIALLIWFFRVVMYTASHWMMFEIPTSTLFYSLVAGLVEMLALGVLFGLTLHPIKP